MNIKNKVRSAKCGGITRAKRALRSKVATGVLGALVAVGLSAFAAEPTVTVDEVKTGELWSKITVNYTLGGTDAKLKYKVAFDVTAKDQTASVTNDAAILTEGPQPQKEIDTAALFGKQVVDTKANVKVTLIAIKPKVVASVQLWENGPYFAECNIGASKPEEYGYYFWWGDTVGYVRNSSKNGWVSAKDGKTTISFSSLDTTAGQTYYKDAGTLKSEKWIDDSGNLVVSDDAATNRDAARAHLGAPWRMMTDAELQNLTDTSVCERTWTDDWKGTGKSGYVVKGKGDYASNSIFLPAAGYGYRSGLDDAGSDGNYWSSTPDSDDDSLAWYLNFKSSDFRRSDSNRFYGFSVRPVRSAE